MYKIIKLPNSYKIDGLFKKKKKLKKKSKKKKWKKIDYNKYIKSKKWYKKRNWYFKNNDNICKSCGSNENIHLHHINYDRLGNEKMKDLMPLCIECHTKLHEKYGSKDILNSTKAFLMEEQYKKELFWNE